jgi:hypothetical protein
VHELPSIVIKYTIACMSPATQSPGVAEASALPWVVTTTDTHSGATPPLAFTTLSAISVSRSIADAGTGEPGTGPAKASSINLAQPPDK